MGFTDDQPTLSTTEPAVIVLDSPQTSHTHTVAYADDDWTIPETVKRVRADAELNQISPVPLFLISDDEDDLEELEKQVLGSSWSRRLAGSYKKSEDMDQTHLDTSPLKWAPLTSPIKSPSRVSYVERSSELTEIEANFDLTMENSFDETVDISPGQSLHPRDSPEFEGQISFDLTSDSYSLHVTPTKHDTIIVTSSDPLDDTELESLTLQKLVSHSVSKPSRTSPDCVRLRLVNDENRPRVNENSRHPDRYAASNKPISFFEREARKLDTSLQEIEFERVRRELARRKKSESTLKSVGRSDKEYERQQKKLEREAKKLEKQQQKEEKEREKAKERQLREVNNLRLDKLDCCKEMIVNIDEALMSNTERAGITVALEEILVEVNPKACQIPNSIELERRIQAEFDQAKDMWIPIVPRVQEEKTILVVLTWENFIEKVGKQELYSFIHDIYKVHPGKRIAVIIEGLSTFIKKRKRVESRNFVNQVLTQTTDEDEEPMPKVTRRKGKPKKGDVSTGPDIEQVEQQLVWLQMVGKCLLVHTKSIEETNTMIAVLIKDISTIPYKKRNTQLKFCVEGQVKSGTSAKEVWELMLQQIHLVTPNVARSIIYEYPTLKSLYDAYKLMPNPDEAQLMLQDVAIGRSSAGVAARRLGPALSKRIYQFFMGHDPNHPIT
ncbi:hypothetical protein K493DRAFT_310168 [Basidiobolus meristosporus CBS 931.73]|uniref:ERCC4 domain-containing protein n=1 Tax=Basidiobolus meristosporus CBS 931.73 TaxID=1314790 RepID=A0A1Y1ZBE5_9FUNG|nr:hypothetical protein K493DRAFT_310168 [Basidiobolus meristosporus CBS 931.73]|eukprot:ORY07633.1 hypothetical protein K493DRAFT_310168 [Basidiobolus meristosporus CBS 931.73]